MIGTIALVAAAAFVATALWRLAPAAPGWLPRAELVLAIAAGVAGIAASRVTGDTRWLVGGVLLFGAAVPAYRSRGRRGLAIAVVVVALIGLALFAIATARPMLSVAP